jgi:protein farnesyltransferase subunit beta
MPFRIPLRKKRGIHFPKMQNSEYPDKNPSSSQDRVEELSSEEDIPTSEMAQTTFSPTEVPIPPLFTSRPPIRDDLVTITSDMQDETLLEVLPYLTEPEGDLNVFGRQFVAADASRPWMLYWALAGLSMLDVDVSEYRERWVSQ